MKSLLYKISFGAIVALMLSSCQDYLESEIATPNNPTEVSPGLILTSAQVSTFATYSGQLVRQSSLFTQQLAGTAAGSQSIEMANYVVTETTNENEWNGIYAGAVADCNSIITTYGETNPHYAGIAKVIKALNIGAATDLWGDVPFSEASTAAQDGNVDPAYDTQATVLSSIASLLDEAIADLSKEASANEFFPSSDDLIYGGNISAWVKTARVIKARYANRLSEVNPASSASNVLDALSEAYVGSEDDAFMPFFGGNATNQWFAFESGRTAYYRVGEAFADLLIDNNDPRLSYFLGTNSQGGYSGTAKDDIGNDSSSYVGDIYATATSPLPLVTYVEQKFLEAEAHFRLSETQDAATAFNEAVIASVTQVTGMAPAEDFISSTASEDAGSITLEKIMTQKHIALFIQLESYSDWRRTGIPARTANPNAGISGIPVRLITPLNERLYNSNAVVVSDLLAPVYWDQ